MKNFCLLFYFLCFSYVFSQETLIATKFIEEGNLFENIEKPDVLYIQFKKNHKCFVIDYLGRNTYKVKFKDFSGFVSDDFLDINEEMMDLYYDFEEKERLKAIAEDEERKRKIREIVNNKAEKEQAILDSINQIEIVEKQELVGLAQAKQDSIAKVEAEILRKQIEVAQEAKKQEERLEKARQEALEKQKALKVIAKQEELARLAKAKQDSIAKVEAEILRKQIEAAQEAKKQEERLEKARQEALEKQKALKVIAKQEELARLAQAKQDSIAKVEAEILRKQVEAVQEAKKQEERLEKARQEVLEKQMALEAIAKQEELARLAQAKQDSIAKVEAEILRKQVEVVQEAKKQEEKRLVQVKQDSLFRLREDEKRKERIREEIRKEEIEFEAQKEQDDILNNKSISGVSSEKENFRNTCHYLINEYDQFYQITTIRTEPCKLANDLTVELYKQDRKVNIFFNLSKDLGCVSYLPNQRSSVRVTLENNQVVSFYHSWDIECGEFLFKGNLTSSKVVSLKKSPIKSILLKGTKDALEITNIIYKEFFIDKLKCIE